MTAYIYLDGNNLANAYKVGGLPYLNDILSYLTRIGLSPVVTDQVYDEILRNTTSGAAITQWLQSNGLAGDSGEGISTSVPARVADGTLASKDAGDYSMLEQISKNYANGDTAFVFSDDKFFTTQQRIARLPWSNDTTGLPSDFIKTNVETSAYMANSVAAFEKYSNEEYSQLRDDYYNTNSYDETKNGYSPKLDQFLQDSEFNLIVEAAETQVGINALEVIQQTLSETGDVLLAGYVITSYAQAISQYAQGNTASGNQILGEMAGAIPASILGGLAGTELGATFGTALGQLLGVMAESALVGAEEGSLWGPWGSALGAVFGLVAGVGGTVIGAELGQEIGKLIPSWVQMAFSYLADFSKRLLPPGILDVSPLPVDPLVLDLSGAGINLTALAGSPAYFDYTGSGFAHETGWIKSGEGFLYLDNGSGSTTVTASELLGALSGSGFADLAALDTNHDGVIDNKDAAFNSLRVWVAGSDNGHSNAGDTFTLAQLGITSIQVNGVSSESIVLPSSFQLNGNAVISTASFAINGASHTIAEVNFQTSTTLVQYNPPAGFVYSSASLILPFLDSYGLLPNLQAAMTQNPALLSAVHSLVVNASSMSYSDFDAAFQNVLEIWANAATIDPASKGAFVNARDLAVAYAFYGIDPATQPIYATNPNWHNGPLWEQAYRSIVDALEIRFASQVTAAQILNGVSVATAETGIFAAYAQIQFDPSTDSVSTNLTDLISVAQSNAPTDPSKVSLYWAGVTPLIQKLSSDVFAGSNQDMAVSFAAATNANGVDISIASSFVSSLGFSLLDEGATAGTITGEHVGAILMVGTNDKIISGAHPNTYIYGLNGGNDVIDDGNTSSKLVFSGIASTGVTLSRDGSSSDLVFQITATGKTVTIKGQFSYYHFGQLQSFTFSDGVTWSATDVQQTLLNQEAALQSGSIYGFSTNDILTAGAGDKYLNGEGGSDTYMYSSLGGNDVIDDGNTSSKLVFSDIASTGVTLSRIGSSGDLIFNITATGKTVTAKGQMSYYHFGQLQSFAFSDGVTWSAADAQQILLNQQSAASSGSIYGFPTDDTLVAGSGDKYLNGEGGSDTYIYSSLGGNDVIDDGNASSKLVFSDIASTGVALSRSGSSSDLTITIIATGKTVTVKGQFGEHHFGQLQSFTFSDGVTWSAADAQQILLNLQSAAPSGSIYGFPTDDTLIAGTGDKYLNGEGGADTYVYSSSGGNDVIDDGNTSSKLAFSDIASTGVTLSGFGSSSDLIITIIGTGKTVTVKGQFGEHHWGQLQNFTFSNGVTWSAADVQNAFTTAPTVTITSSAESSNLAAQAISGTVVSGGAAVVVGQTVTLKDNGTTIGTAKVGSNGSFTANVTLPNQGANSIVASVTDSYGNTGTSSAVVDSLDSVAPTVTITSSAESSSVAAQTISGTVVSGGAAVVVGQTVTLKDNGTTIGTAKVGSNGSFTANVTLPNQGANSIVASVTDSYGNTGTSSAVVDTLNTSSSFVAGALIDDTTHVYKTTYEAIWNQATGLLQIVDTASSNLVLKTYNYSQISLSHALFSLTSDGNGGTEVSVISEPFVTPGPNDILYSSIQGQPNYNAYQQVFSGGVNTETDYISTNVSGQPNTSYVNRVAAGGQAIGGTTFNANVTGQSYTGLEYDYTSTGQITRVVATGVVGQPYSSNGVNYVGGVLSGTWNLITNVPSTAAYSSQEMDYDWAGNYAGQKQFYTNITGQSWTGGEIDYDANNVMTKATRTGITGQSYTSEEFDYIGGVLSQTKTFASGITGQPYTNQEIDTSASGQILRTIISSNETGTGYSSLETDYAGSAVTKLIYGYTNIPNQSYYAGTITDNSAGVQQQIMLDNNDGSHQLTGYAANQTFYSLGNDTMTGGYGGDTFVFNNIYGHDTITDFASHTTGTSHDTISLASSEFANFAAVLSHSANSGSNVVITAADGDTLTLNGMTTTALAKLSADFTFHA